jgi:biotin transport system substrate-specific component
MAGMSPGARAAQVSAASTVALIIAGSMLMAIGARLSLHLAPLTPVPITGQTLALPLVVAALGTRLSVLAMFAYLAEGAIGLPVFAEHGRAGLLYLTALPTAGYLWSCPIAAWVIGSLFDRGMGATVLARAAAIFVGTAVVFIGGALWLSRFVGPAHAVALGVVPFIPGDLLKVAIATGLAPYAARLPGLLRQR